MKIYPQLHHYAQIITKNSLNDILEMYEVFNCKVTHRPNDSYTWAIVGQDKPEFRIQIIETEDKPIADIKVKRSSHLGFLSDNPQEVIDKVENWAKNKNIRFIQGQWSEKELYFDLPDLFTNFVIEVMHTSVVE